MSKCVVCSAPTSGSLEFCKKDFIEHKKDIQDKKPWVKMLKNEAQRERRRMAREFEDTSLDAMLDTTYSKNY